MLSASHGWPWLKKLNGIYGVYRRENLRTLDLSITVEYLLDFNGQIVLRFVCFEP